MNDRDTTFRWAILGTGAVARKFALGLRELGPQVSLHSVASRNIQNARRFAADLGVPHAVANYREAIQGEADAVYIATPPALHEEHALLAIRAGKPVLIEKPIAADAAAAQRIAGAAQEAQVFCMEAMWTRFQPLVGAIKAQIGTGALGALRGYEGRFMMANEVASQSGIFDAAQGGGALMHRGIYPLSLARFFLGPVKAHYAAAQIGKTGVDEDSALILHHESGAISTLRSSLRSGGPDQSVLYGTKAELLIAGPIWRPQSAVIIKTPEVPAVTGGPRRFEAFRESGAGLRLTGTLALLSRLTGRGRTRLRAPYSGNGYHYEAEALMAAVAAGRVSDSRMPLDESVEIMHIIDQARASWARGRSR